MTLEIWLAYVALTVVLLLMPGPTIMLVVGYALVHGRRSGWSTVTGVALGDLTAMTLSLAGLGAVLATSATLFTAVKWIGAAYLIYLGVKMWRAAPVPADTAAQERPRSDWRIAAHAFVVTALNPKGIVFFVAFLPQFITPAAPALPQMIVLGATFSILAILSTAGYALLAGSLRDAVREPRALKAVNRVGGGVLIGAGVLTAALRRAT